MSFILHGRNRDTKILLKSHFRESKNENVGLLLISSVFLLLTLLMPNTTDMIDLIPRLGKKWSGLTRQAIYLATNTTVPQLPILIDIKFNF